MGGIAALAVAAKEQGESSRALHPERSDLDWIDE
jgi:hypothetical protein